MLTSMRGVRAEAYLPPFWQRMANCKKKEGINILQAMLHNRAETPGAFPHVPVVTPELYNAISEFCFGSTNMDDLLAGLNPFVISNGADADEAQYDRQRSANYVSMFMGNTAPTLGEVQELRASAPQMCPFDKQPGVYLSRPDLVIRHVVWPGPSPLKHLSRIHSTVHGDEEERQETNRSSK